MKNPSVRDMVESIGLDDLEKLKADLDGGGKHLKTLVSTRINELESRPRKICATCGNPLTEEDGHLTMIFGPPDLRKQASFCAYDCLDYFLERLKGMKREVRE